MTRFTPVAWLDAFSEEKVKRIPTEAERNRPKEDLKMMRHKAFSDLAERLTDGRLKML